MSQYGYLGLPNGCDCDLWVHAVGRLDALMPCESDEASLRFGIRGGYAGIRN